MSERVILKAGKRKQILQGDNIYQNEYSSIDISKRIQLIDDFEKFDQIFKKYCDLDVPILESENKPVFEQNIHSFDDSCKTKLQDDIKKINIYDQEMENYNHEFQKLQVSEIDYIKEYGLDCKEADNKSVSRHYGNKKIHKNKFQ